MKCTNARRRSLGAMRLTARRARETVFDPWLRPSRTYNEIAPLGFLPRLQAARGTKPLPTKEGNGRLRPALSQKHEPRRLVLCQGRRVRGRCGPDASPSNPARAGRFNAASPRRRQDRERRGVIRMNEATEGIHCASCGKVFQPARRGDAVTCSAACRQRLHRKRARRATLRKRIERAKQQMSDAERMLAALDDAAIRNDVECHASKALGAS